MFSTFLLKVSDGFDETSDPVGLLGVALVVVGIFLLNVYSDAYSPVQ